MARLSRTMSAWASLPMRLPSFAFGMVVILSTISREVALSPFASVGSTAIRRRGASVGSLVKAQIRDGFGGVETIVLHDYHRPRLARVVSTPGSGPDLAALHSSPPIEITSMKAWSLAACRLDATRRDCVKLPRRTWRSVYRAPTPEWGGGPADAVADDERLPSGAGSSALGPAPCASPRTAWCSPSWLHVTYDAVAEVARMGAAVDGIRDARTDSLLIDC